MTRDEMLTQLRQSLAEAGLPLNQDLSPRPRGGVRLVPIDEPFGRPAVRVSWSVHHVLYADLRRGRDTLELLDVMDTCLMAVLFILGWDIAPGQPRQPPVVIGRRGVASPIAAGTRRG